MIIKEEIVMEEVDKRTITEEVKVVARMAEMMEMMEEIGSIREDGVLQQ